MIKQKYSLHCSYCNSLETNSIIGCSKCHGSLIAEYNYSEDEGATGWRDKELIDNSIFETFRLLLPFNASSSFIKLHSYLTPILDCTEISEKYNSHLQAKLEFLQLTGSVKDREAVIEVTKAKELGYKTLVVASTGNLASSLASHCQKARITCQVFVPSTTSESKLKQIRAYGSDVHKMDLDYDQIASHVREIADKNRFFLGGLQAFRTEGYKTVAYEIFIQSEIMPERVIVPMGDATTFVGIWRGFSDLFRMKLIKKMPKMIGVQEKGLDPIAICFHKKGKLETDFHGIAKAIHIGNPLDGNLAIQAMQETGGECLSVTTKDIEMAYNDLALLQGVYTEYTSATTLAAFKKLSQSTILNGNTMLILTGHGLKN